MYLNLLLGIYEEEIEFVEINALDQTVNLSQI